MKILFTGGGSAGHVTPNFPLIHALKNKGADIFYVGSKKGIERELITQLNIPYYSITTGKLRRYWSWKNFLTPFQFILGIIQSLLICYRLNPNRVFSKGGFVALPVVIAAWLYRIPVIVHESDLTPGLANRMSFPFAKRVCITSPITARYFRSKKKIIVTGLPIREFLYHGNKLKGLKLCNFKEKKRVLLVMAGGLGSIDINTTIRRLLNSLTKKIQVVHICGKNKMDDKLSNSENYKQFEYLHQELADVLAAADLVISRAGATSIYELLALKKPHILLPLSKQASRGDQIENANYFSKQGLSTVILSKEFSDTKLLKTIFDCYSNLELIKNKLMKLPQNNSVCLISKQLL